MAADTFARREREPYNGNRHSSCSTKEGSETKPEVEHDSAELAVGSWVELHGLTATPEINGQCGVLDYFDVADSHLFRLVLFLWAYSAW